MATRLTELDQVLFPVDITPIFVRTPCGALKPIPGKRAVVDTRSWRTVSVVGDRYRLVTNQQALDCARRCCRLAFPDTQAEEWDVRTVDGPSTGVHCRVDLIHATATFNPFRGSGASDPDVFSPFVRMTNSYNGTKAPCLHFGFLRELCSNGLIVPKESVRIYINHGSPDIDHRIHNKLDERLSIKLRENFTNFVQALRNCDVPRQFFKPILRAALRLDEPTFYKRSTVAAWAGIDACLDDVSYRYSRALGDNGYGLLNAMTDFASNPPQNQVVRRDRHSFQALAGNWLSGFSKECKKGSFDAERYVSGLSDPAKNAATAKREHQRITRQAA